MSSSSRVAPLLLLLLTLAPSPARAQDAAETPPLRVGVKAAPPFVLLEGEEPRGLSVDLLREVAARMDPPRQVELVVHPDLTSHLEAVRAGEVDLGIAATTVTRGRAQTLDFSLPFYRGGLSVLVRAEGGLSLWDMILSRELGFTLLWVSLFVLGCAHVVWLAERGSDGFADAYGEGLPQAIWWTIVTMSTVGYGDFVPKRNFSRAVAILVIFSGIILFGVAIASFTSALTVHELKTDIKGVDDLVDRPVAVVEGTTAADLMAQRRVRLRPFPSLDAALAAVVAGEADALVHDEPVLRHWLSAHTADLSLVGGVFRRQDYAMTLPLGSPLRKPLNLAFLAAKEDPSGAYLRIVRKWVGGDEGE